MSQPTSAPRYRAIFSIARIEGEPGMRTVWITDDAGSRPVPSVTNDAEAVVANLNYRWPRCRIIYRDSMGNWDELLHDNGRFVGYAPARELAKKEGMA